MTTIRTFGLSSSSFVGNNRPMQAHTHTHTHPDVFLYTPPRSCTHTHTHTIARIRTDAEVLSCTHTHFQSHTQQSFAQHHSPWCFTAVFPGTGLSLAQSLLSKKSSRFQLGEEGFFSIPPLLLLKTYTTCTENAELWKSGRMREWEEEQQGGEREGAGREEAQ